MKPADMLKEGQTAFFAKPPDYQRAKDCSHVETERQRRDLIPAWGGSPRNPAPK